MVDALLTSLKTKLLGFEFVKDLYAKDILAKKGCFSTNICAMFFFLMMFIGRHR